MKIMTKTEFQGMLLTTQIVFIFIRAQCDLSKDLIREFTKVVPRTEIRLNCALKTQLSFQSL